jgi:hypothetical protein
MRKDLKPILLFILLLIIFESVLIYAADITRPPWGDEIHYLNAIRLFSDEISVNTLRSYNELAAPLPFILYALWGRVFGLEMHILRLFSVLIACLTYTAFFTLLMTLFNKGKLAILITFFLILNPYMVGLNIFVYNDMLTILFLIAGLFFAIKKSPVPLALSLAAGLLCRQYFIFFTLAAAIYFMLGYMHDRSRGTLYMLIASIVSLLPFTALALIWGGLTPQNALGDFFLNESASFHVSFFVLYVSQLFIYLFPFVILCYKHFYSRKTLLLAALCSAIYFYFPVRAATTSHVSTVGFFHRALNHLLNNPLLVDASFYTGFLLGLSILIYIIKDSYIKLTKREFGLSLLLDLSVLMFLLIMPLSYFCWEKYFLPLMPILLIRILKTRYHEVSFSTV